MGRLAVVAAATGITVTSGDIGLVLGALAAVLTAMVAWRRFRPDTVAQITATVERALAIANAATERAEQNAARLENELSRRHIEVEELRTQLRQGRDSREFLLAEIRRLEARIAQLEAALEETRRGEEARITHLEDELEKTQKAEQRARLDEMDRRAERSEKKADKAEDVAKEQELRNDDTPGHA